MGSDCQGFSHKIYKRTAIHGSRKKKSAINIEKQQCSLFKCFLTWSHDCIICADKMMNRAKGPTLHKKQKNRGLVPKRLQRLDKEAMGALPIAWLGTFSSR